MTKTIETDVRTYDSSNSDETSSASRDNADILPGVLTFLAYTVMAVVEIGDSLSQRLDTGGRTLDRSVNYAMFIQAQKGTYVFTARHGYINVMGSFETSLDFIIDFWGALTQVGPFLWVFSEAMLVGSLSSPDDSSGCTRRVQSSMRFVSFMSIAKLAVDG